MLPSWQPPTVEEYFAWLRQRWAQKTLQQAACMTYLEQAVSDEDADRQLRTEGKNSFARMAAAGVLRPDLTVLEIGCGAGRVATELTDYLTCGRYIGVDLSPQYVELCRQRCPRSTFHVTPGIGVPAVATGSVDLVAEFTVFCHMAPEAVFLWLLEAARVLKSGGRTWLQFHNAASVHQFEEFVRRAERHRFITDPGSPQGMDWVMVQRMMTATAFTIKAAHGVDVDDGGPRSWFVVAEKE